MRKSEKNTGMNKLVHGRDSVTVKKLQEKLNMLPLDDVKKMEFKTMLDTMESTSWAFDFDTAIKKHLVDSLQDTDKKIMSYMADLQNTQVRIAKIQKDSAFHEAVLQQLKTDWINEQDPILKAQIYVNIQETEKTLNTFESNVSKYIELRNKIRKEIDKGKYQDKALKLKEEELAGTTAKPIDVNFEVL